MFNDDFFILNQVDTLNDYFRYDIDYELKARLNKQYNEMTMKSLLLTQEQKKYNLHIPMSINRNNFSELYNIWMTLKDKNIDFRTLYGNMFLHSINGMNDCKIFSLNEVPTNETFISTTNASFNMGNTGNYIKEKFNIPTIFEML